MSRIRCPEIADQPWCPRFVRNAITDCLQFFVCLFNQYGCVVERLWPVLQICNTRNIVDLCSGSGGPWLRLMREFDVRKAGGLHVVLTDKAPNAAALARHAKRYPGRVTAYPRPVDASAIPSDLSGFRTYFSSFHHFDPDQARALLADAVKNREGIGIFEITQRSAPCILLTLIIPLPMLLSTPFIRPFRWWRLLLTYVFPVIPAAMVFDGIASCLRTYSPRELWRLTDTLNDCGYRWECGMDPPAWQPVTYLIGYPENRSGIGDAQGMRLDAQRSG